MTESATAELIAVGDEVLAGQTVDTNAAWLAHALAAIGVETRWHTAVGDRVDDIAEALRCACARASVAIVGGGLGPTPDDITRDAAATLIGRPLVERAPALRHMQRLFASMCRPMASSNRRQALFPTGARLLPNRRGTAYGFSLTHLGTACYFLPGVPAEMRAMTPRLIADIARRVPGAVPRHAATLRTVGIGESDMVERLGGLLQRGGDPEVGTYASEGILTIRVTGTNEAAVRRRDDAIAERLDAWVYARGEQTLEEVVVERMRQAGRTVALAESCTGGLLAELLTRVPGSSSVFLEGAVAYSNAAKTRTCGVPAETIRSHGAVSAPVARALAEGIRHRAEADIGIGITGIAGPGGGSAAKPVGLVYIARADESGTDVREHRFGGDRDRVRHRAARAALETLWRSMPGKTSGK